MTVSLNPAWTRGISAIRSGALQKDNCSFSLFGREYIVSTNASRMFYVQTDTIGSLTPPNTPVLLQAGAETKIGDVCFLLQDRKINMRIDQHVLKLGKKLSFELGDDQTVILTFSKGESWRVKEDGGTGNLFIIKTTRKLAEATRYFRLFPGDSPEPVNHFEISTDGKTITVSPLQTEVTENRALRWIRHLLGLNK